MRRWAGEETVHPIWYAEAKKFKWLTIHTVVASTYPSISASLSVCLSVCLSTYLPIYPSIYPSSVRPSVIYKKCLIDALEYPLSLWSDFELPPRVVRRGGCQLKSFKALICLSNSVKQNIRWGMRLKNILREIVNSCVSGGRWWRRWWYRWQFDSCWVVIIGGGSGGSSGGGGGHARCFH